VACAEDEEPPTGDAGRVPTERAYPEVPGPPASVPDPDELRFFTAREARAMDALTATIFPGDPGDPGAREACVVNYIDNRLAAFEGGVATRHYSKPPFAETFSGPVPPPAAGRRTIWVSEDEISRYGPQSALNARETYRKGLASLDRHCTDTYGSSFADLTTGQQEAVVGALADDRASGFDEPSAQSFFSAVRGDVAEGMFSDPAYGGNRDLVGWKLLLYPGIHRAWTPADIKGETSLPNEQSFCDLEPFNYSHGPGPNIVRPESGSRDGHETRQGR
jgi:hypothetical protein